MSDAIDALIKRLELTLVRQEKSVAETKSQLEAARKLKK